MIICYFHIFMAMRKWILFLCSVSLMGLLFTFTWKLLHYSLILQHIREGFSPLVALFWTWERAHRHLASVKSTCKIQSLFKGLMRMQQSVSVDNLEWVCEGREYAQLDLFYLWLSQTIKCFCVPTQYSFLDPCIWKGFAGPQWNATYFFLCSPLLKYCGLHLSAPDKPKSYPVLCWLLVLTSSTVCSHGNMPVWLQGEPDPCVVVHLGGPGSVHEIPAGFHELWMSPALSLAGVMLPCVSLPCHLAFMCFVSD